MSLYPNGSNITASKGVPTLSANELAESAQLCIQEIAEAIRTNQLQMEKERIGSFLKQYELQYNRLDIKEHKEAFYFGQLSAVMLLAHQLQNNDDEIILFRSIAHSNPKLSDCVIAIGEYDMLSSKELRKKLNMKHRSNLSNLIKRQARYSFIVSYRFGNENMYKLSKRGQEFYFFIIQENKRKPDDRQMENTVSALLKAITHCIKRNTLDSVSIARAFLTSDKTGAVLVNSAILQRQFKELSDAFELSQRCALQLGLRDFVSRREIKNRDRIHSIVFMPNNEFELGDEFR